MELDGKISDRKRTKMRKIKTKIELIIQSTITNVKETFKPLYWLNVMLGLFSNDISMDESWFKTSLIYAFCLYIFYGVNWLLLISRPHKTLTTYLTVLSFKVMRYTYAIFFFLSALHSFFNVKVRTHHKYV